MSIVEKRRGEIHYSREELMIWWLMGLESLDISDAERDSKAVVAGLRFDVLGLYQALLEPLDEGENIFDVYRNWSADAHEDTFKNLGSDCFGLSSVLRKLLIEKGLDVNFVALDTQGLPATESVEVTGDIGSLALMFWEGETVNILDPGFGLTKPLKVSPENNEDSVRCDGKIFSLTVDFKERKGILTVKSDNFPPKVIGIRLESIDPSIVNKVQKDYVQIRPTIHCDRFDHDGEKIAGIKVKLLSEQIVITLSGNKVKINFDDWNDYPDKEKLADELTMSSSDLDSQVHNTLRRAGQIRALWTKSLKDQYFENTKKASLVNEERSWKELRKERYVGGGVVSFIVNDSNQILLYKVPQTREKPHIGRYAGQLNSMVETCEDDEEFLPNLQRGLEEELGIVDANAYLLDKDSYRETDYGKPFENGDKILARCCVVKWSGGADSVSFGNDDEGSQWGWYDLDTVLGHEIDPNLRPILERYILEDII